MGASGGEEVLLDVGGQDATEAFEDVGHSDEAREILEGLKVGKLKRMVGLAASLKCTIRAADSYDQPGDPEPKAPSSVDVQATAKSGGSGIGMYAVIAVGAVLALGVYQYLQANQNK